MCGTEVACYDRRLARSQKKYFGKVHTFGRPAETILGYQFELIGKTFLQAEYVKGVSDEYDAEWLVE